MHVFAETDVTASQTTRTGETLLSIKCKALFAMEQTSRLSISNLLHKEHTSHYIGCEPGHQHMKLVVFFLPYLSLDESSQIVSKCAALPAPSLQAAVDGSTI